MSVSTAGNMRPAGRPQWCVRAHDDVTYSIDVAEPLCDPQNRALVDSGGGTGHRLIAWDSGVPASWRSALRDYFTHYGVSATFVTIEGGESCKNLETAMSLVGALHHHDPGGGREPLIVVGGGAVLDVAGFAASIYRWGFPVIRIPTTLLAYVDASVGIKTGVNFSGGKNLVGTFTPPGRVLLDCAFFSSLSEPEWTSGIGEILKLGLGCDKFIFELLEQGVDTFRPGRCHDEAGRTLLSRSIDVMLAELDGNIYEDDLARTVDLGHTFSQSFEMGASAMRHGHAVAVDLLMSAYISACRGMLPQSDLGRLVAVTRAFGLPLAPPLPDPTAAWASVVERTQHRNEKQRIPVPAEIGRCEFLNDLTFAEVEAALRWAVSTDAGRRACLPRKGTP